MPQIVNPMPYFHYTIQKNSISSINGVIPKLPDGFHLYETSFGAGDIYYKSNGAEISEVVCNNDLGQSKSNQEVSSFLSSLNFS